MSRADWMGSGNRRWSPHVGEKHDVCMRGAERPYRKCDSPPGRSDPRIAKCAQHDLRDSTVAAHTGQSNIVPSSPGDKRVSFPLVSVPPSEVVLNVSPFNMLRVLYVCSTNSGISEAFVWGNRRLHPIIPVVFVIPWFQWFPLIQHSTL